MTTTDVSRLVSLLFALSSETTTVKQRKEHPPSSLFDSLLKRKTHFRLVVASSSSISSASWNPFLAIVIDEMTRLRTGRAERELN